MDAMDFRGPKSEMRACLAYGVDVHFAELNLSTNQWRPDKNQCAHPKRTNVYFDEPNHRFSVDFIFFFVNIIIITGFN